MKYIKYSLLMVLILCGLSVAKAQVGVSVGVGPVLVTPYVQYSEPICQWGYYPYYPYDCAPAGFYDSDWFIGGIFIGAGPWYRTHYHWFPGYGWGHVYGPSYPRSVRRQVPQHYSDHGSFHGGNNGFHANGGFHGGGHR